MRVFSDGQQARNNNLNYWSYLYWVVGNLINMGLGWSAPIQVTVCTIDSCYSLNRGTRHLERSFHLSNTQGGLSPPRQERIITSYFPGGLSPPREDYHLSPCRFRIVTPICRDKGQTIRKVVVGGMGILEPHEFFFVIKFLVWIFLGHSMNIF